MTHIDYLVIGTVTLDLTPEGPTAGGTVSYSGRVAQALGCQTAALTSAAADFDVQKALPGIAVRIVPAEKTTTFTNTYTPAGRIQTLHGVASPLMVADLPAGWDNPSIVHLGPLVREVDINFARHFPNSLVGLTPQGWMRVWDEQGRVSARVWPDAAEVLPLADAVILSAEDLLYPEMLDEYRALSKLVVLTESARGCIVYTRDETRKIPAPAVVENEPTGAGDIFAAAFLTYLHRTGGDPWEAARRANEVAAVSVTVAGLDAKIDRIVARQAAW